MKKKRKILLNPGPVTMTETIRQALLSDDIGAKEDEFNEVMTRLREKLLEICRVDRSTHDSVLFSGSGTLGMEATIVSLLPKDKKILLIENGSFSNRALQIIKAFELPYVHYPLERTQTPDLKHIEQILKENDDIAVVYVTHHETGSGLLNPIEDIGQLAHQYGAVLIADCVSSFGLIPIDLATGNVDVIFAATQKGLYAPSGLSFVLAKKEVLENSKEYPVRNFYTNLYGQYQGFRDESTMRFTAPVQTVYAALQGARELLEEGIQQRYQRTTNLYRYIQQKLKPYNLKEVITNDNQGHLVVSIYYPDFEDFDYKELHDYCDERGYSLYPKQSSIPKTLRISAIGDIDENDIDGFFDVFDEYWTLKNFPRIS